MDSCLWALFIYNTYNGDKLFLVKYLIKKKLLLINYIFIYLYFLLLGRCYNFNVWGVGVFARCLEYV
jgi:hypothetical protein